MSVNYGCRRSLWFARLAGPARDRRFDGAVHPHRVGTSAAHQRRDWLRQMGGYFQRPVDEGIDLLRVHCFGLSRMGRYARCLDGLHQARGHSFGSTSFHIGLAAVVSRLGHSGSLEALSHDS